MPLSLYTHEFVEVEVSDRIFAGTTIKQKARFSNMSIVQKDNGDVSLLVWVRVSLYANVEGAYGELIAGNGFSAYDIPLTANNDSAVDPSTGLVLYQKTNQNAQGWLDFLNSKPEPLILQGNYFEHMLHHSPVEIGPMLVSFIKQADAAPYNKFS